MKRSLLLLLMGSLLPLVIFSQKPVRTIYAIKGADTLWFDQYRAQAHANGISVLFIHGGAFSGGNPESLQPMANDLAKLGYQVFVMKYRLYLTGRGFGCETPTPEKLKAVRMAVEDARDATAYLVNHAAEWQVDTSKIFIGGSSAGAETALNLVFNPFIKKGDTGYNLYNTFRYAGLMSFSGGVLDLNPVYKHASIPVLLMHGTKDELVPFGTAGHRFCNACDEGWMIMFGSNTLYEEMKKRNFPVYLYAFRGKGHEVSGYMFRKIKEMDSFMQDAVHRKNKKPFSILLPGL